MRCVLLLRGINVGGKNKVSMAALKQVLSDAGFTEVSTLLQSGNVVLESPDSEEETLSVARKVFTERFGFSCGILLRDSAQFSALLAEKPFSMEEIERAEAADPAVEHRYVYFLPCMPDRTRPAALPEDGDRIFISEREIHLLCAQSIRLSRTAARLTAAFPDATVRNWNTVEKIAENMR